MIPHKATINGAVLTIHEIHISMLNDVVAHLDLEQFSVIRGTGENIDTWTISAPINKVIAKEYAGIIHRHNAELRAKNRHLIPDDPGPKGTPPAGGTPGAARVTKFENTVAIAA